MLNNKDVLSTFKEEYSIIHKVVSSIKKKVPIELSSTKDYKNIVIILKKIENLKSYQSVDLFQCFKLKNDNRVFNLLVLTITTLVKQTRNNHIYYQPLLEYEFTGLLLLKKRYGNVYIRPEKLQDKINEWVNPVEVDFELDKEFSKKYYVLASNKVLLLENISPIFLNAIKKYEGLEIEIQDNILFVRLRQKVSLKSANIITNFLNTLSKADV